MEHFNVTERLHTDVLEDKYGPITAQVMHHDHRLREAHLVDARGISRTYALTFFPESGIVDELEGIDSQIRNGGAVGKVFREHGYPIRKNVIDVYMQEIPSWLRAEFSDHSKFAKARLSEFFAKSTGSPILYGTVVEIYSPDFRLPLIHPVDMSQINPVSSRLAEVGVTRDELWRRLGDENFWPRTSEEYTDAKVKSLDDVFSFRARIEQYLSSKQ